MEKISHENILFEMFSWLPAKSICKLKPTCKSFSSNFSKEHFFKTKQSRNLSQMDDTCFFIQPEQIFQRYERRVELHALSKNQQSSGIPKDVLNFLSNSTSILSSSNGLILCQTLCDEPTELFVCNPITKSRSLIPIPDSLRNSNFRNINIMLDCISSSSNDYTIILFENTMEWSDSYKCNIYQSNERTWKIMENMFLPGGRNMKFDMPVFHNEAIHFISDNNLYFSKSSPYYKPYIMSYNLKNGTSTMLKLPKEALKGFHDRCNMGIFNWGKKVGKIKRSICLVRFQKLVFTLWYLEDYKVCLWKKILKVRVRTLDLKEEEPFVTGFSVMNGDLLIFSTEEKVYSLGLGDENFMMVEEICRHNCRSHPRFISYIDTFHSCEINATSLEL